MKKYILGYVLLVFNLYSFAQENCTDIIYPANSDDILFNCCIYEVRDKNLVHYIHEGDSLSIRADLIIKDGEHLDLKPTFDEPINVSNKSSVPTGTYNGYNYEHYENLFHKATNLRNLGVGCTVFGIVLVSGAYASSNTLTEEDRTFVNALFISGVILQNVGIAFWISGGVKRGNNKRVLLEMNRQLNLTFVGSRDGIGVRFRF